MAKAKVVLNRSAVRELLKSSEMQAICNEHARRIRDSCGEGYESDSHVGPNRCNSMVWARTYQAKKDNMENNTLLKAVK